MVGAHHESVPAELYQLVSGSALGTTPQDSLASLRITPQTPEPASLDLPRCHGTKLQLRTSLEVQCRYLPVLPEGQGLRMLLSAGARL